MDILLAAVDNQPANGVLHKRLQSDYAIVKELPKTTDRFGGMLDYVDGYGKIRFAYFGSKYKEQPTYHTQESFASAIGGIIGLKTASYKNFDANIAVYISEDLPFLYDTDKRSDEFLDNQHNSYAYVAEASINYHDDRFNIMLGRFVIDTPFANSDDIRMSQNSFEGAFGQYSITEKIDAQLFYISRWAGYDSADDTTSQNEFKKLVDDSYGMIGASISYEYAQDSSLSFYYQNIEKLADIYYVELNGVYPYNEDVSFDYGLQFAHQVEDENSGVDGDVYGAMGIVHYQDLYLTFAANFARVSANKVVSDGFGGGPFFTSLDEATIAAASEHRPGSDANMYRTGLGYEAQNIHSTFEYAYGYIDLGGVTLDEHDLIYSFSFNDAWNAEAILVRYITDTNELNRAIVRVEYNF